MGSSYDYGFNDQTKLLALFIEALMEVDDNLVDCSAACHVLDKLAEKILHGNPAKD